MRKVLFWLVTLLLLAAVAAWAALNHAPHRDYAPGGAEDEDMAVQPAPQPQPQPPAVAPPATLPTPQTDGLPSAPVPYDKLDPAAEPPPPPRAKSDDKAIFY